MLETVLIAICRLTDWRQMAIENTISSDFRSKFLRLLRAFLIAAYLVCEI